jgi:transcriptional regulator with XRE-family HTH domain
MGNRLRVQRAERRQSQMAVAAALAMSFNRYWRIENGYTVPTDDERVLLATHFQTTPSELFPPNDEDKAAVA